MKANLYHRPDWLAAGLLISAVFTAAVRLDTTGWTPDLGYVESLAVLGVILGLAMGISRFGKTALFWLTALYSIFIVPVQLSRIISGEETPLSQLASLGGRFAASLGSLINNKPIEDHIFFVVLMGILFWFAGVYSGFRLMRDRAILPMLLPSTVPILVIQYYDGYKPERIWGLAVYFFLALMLAGRINLINSQERWEAQRVVAGSDPEFDLNKNILSAAAVIILAAWLIPAPAAIVPAAARAWRNFNEPFENVRHRLDDILAALNSSRPNNSAAELYGDLMGLGRTAGSGEGVLFSVQTPPNNIPRLYWKMRTYDTYENGGWQALNTRNTPFEPGEDNLVISDSPPASTATFTFNWQSASSAMLATPSLPVWTSRKGSVQTLLEPEGQKEILSWSVSPRVRDGDQYQVRAVLPNPSQKDLRASGTDYPDWIKEHYLQVPPGISAEFKPLAEQITAGLSNNFDRADAITEYLRENIKYSETVPAPPQGTEPLNWFLFSYKSGYCNYYASAEVMLLRSLGIPSRMVVGFAQGLRGNKGLYTVRGQDAHAWPEVYFPGTGWVQFEPTVNQAALVRPSGESVSGRNDGASRGNFADSTQNNSRFDQEKDEFSFGDAVNNPSATAQGQDPLFLVVLSTLGVIITGILGWRMQKRLSFSIRIPRAVKSFYNFYNIKSPDWLEHWMSWSEASPAERAFHAVNQGLIWLKYPQPSYVTPVERAALLKTLLPEATADIDLLNTTLEKNLFTPIPVDTTIANRAGWKLRIKTIRRIINQKLYGE